MLYCQVDWMRRADESDGRSEEGEGAAGVRGRPSLPRRARRARYVSSHRIVLISLRTAVLTDVDFAVPQNASSGKRAPPSPLLPSFPVQPVPPHTFPAHPPAHFPSTPPPPRIPKQGRTTPLLRTGELHGRVLGSGEPPEGEEVGSERGVSMVSEQDMEEDE